jgi:hypothetical protein
MDARAGLQPVPPQRCSTKDAAGDRGARGITTLARIAEGEVANGAVTLTPGP